MPRTERRLTGEFWAAVDRHQLVRPVCQECGRSHFAPQLLCPHCQSANWQYQPSVGTGIVYSHTTIHRPPDPAFEAPYVVADIEVDDGWRMFSWLVNCDPGDVAIDLPVQVCFVPGADRQLLPGFEPRP